MNIQHEILSFHPATGSLLVRYFCEEVPQGLVYSIDVPLENGSFVGQERIDQLIDFMKPTGQLERAAELASANTPEQLVNFVPVQIPFTQEFATPASYGDSLFVPTFGQDGKDVPWEPMSTSMMNAALSLADIKAGDRVYDLGSGNGDVLIEAVKTGATAVGIEFNQSMVNLSTRRAVAANVADKVTFIKEDLLVADFSDATVVVLYLSAQLNDLLKPKLMAMPAGTRIVSVGSSITGWEPSKTMTLDGFVVYEWTVGA